MERQEVHEGNQNSQKRTAITLGGFVVLFIAVVAVTIIASNIGKNGANESIASVRITDSGFQPATISVQKGTRVVWTNEGQEIHQVAANPYPTGTDLSNLKSAILNNTQSYSFVASTAGTFGYHDQMNPTVNGTLIVKK